MLMLSLGIASSFSQKPFTMNVSGEKVTTEASELKDLVIIGLDASVNILNAQVPMNVDEFTVLNKASRVGMEIFYDYSVTLNRNDYTDEVMVSLTEAVKQNQLAAIYSMLGKQSEIMPLSEWLRLYGELGIIYHYNYVDKNGKLFSRFDIDFKKL